MNPDIKSLNRAIKIETEVLENGRLELRTSLKEGSRVVVLIIEEESDSVDDLLRAAESSLDFWDNPYDDEDWNDA